MADLITISSSVLPDSTRVIGFRGAEAISRPYQIEIFLLLNHGAGDDLDLADAIGAKAKLTIDRTTDQIPPFIFSGILSSIELVHEVENQVLLRAVLSPKLWLLGLSRHSRIFTRKKLPDVIRAVLEDNGLTSDDYELRLGSYEVEEHITQYRESDLDFLSRWMEREGIFYFFEHGEDGEKLILCDKKSYEQDVMNKPVRYHPQTGNDFSAGMSVRTFTCLHATLPSQVRLKDYDYGRPNLALQGTATVAENGAGEVSLYGERFFTPASGQKLAKIRAEELLTRQVVYRASGTRFHFRTGYAFELEDHPRATFNAKYLTIEVHHHGNQAAGDSYFRQLLGLEHDDVYFVELTAIPAKTQFRAESRTAWPRIYGYENGVVDGPADSEYAQIDDQGRYNVKFKFDESALKNGTASTFVRMMQPHGGSVEGFHFPLRKGTEVICTFLGGDPDRPVITGVVPTAVTPSKVVSSNYTQNVIQTGGENYIVMEDKGGSQWVNIFCPVMRTNLYLGLPRPAGPHGLTLPSGPQVPTEGKRPQTLGPFAFDLRTDGGGQIHTGSNLNIDANAQLQIEAHGLTTVYAHSDWHLDVNGAADEKYWTTFKKEVVGAVDIDYKDTLNFDVTAAAIEFYHDTRNLTVHAAETELYENTLTSTVTQLATYTYNNGLNVNVNAALTDEKYNASKKEKVTGTSDLEVTGKYSVTANGVDIKNKADWQEITSGSWGKVVWALTSETSIGLKNENWFGGKVGLTVGFQVDLFAGVKFEAMYGVGISLKAGGYFTAAPAEVKTMGAAFKVVGSQMRTAATAAYLGAMRLMPYAMTIM